MIGWLLETFVATTLLMLLILAIRKPVGRHFGPDIAYALWLLPVLRLALPPLPESWRVGARAPVEVASEAITYYIVDPLAVPQAPAAPLAAPAAAFDWLPLLLAAWAAGALIFLGYHLLAHRRFCADLLRRARVARSVAEGRVQVIETDAATGPLAFGIRRKYVAFPRDFHGRYDPLERNLALAHELGHHLRGDLIANWIALAVLALHWFNPVAWRAFRAFRADQELACDALVLAGRPPALRHAYGRAIVKSARGGAVSAACHLHSINELKARLKMVSKHDRKSPARVASGVTGATLLTLAGLALTASGTQAAANLRADVGAAIGVDLAQAAPVVPAAPAARPAAAPSVQRQVRQARIVAPAGNGQVTIVQDGPDAPIRISAPRIVMKDDRLVVSPDALAGIPTVASARCGGDKDDDVRIERREGDARRIVICTDRIELRAAEAIRRAKLADAMASRQRALASVRAGMANRQAMFGLKMARSSIETQADLDAAQKSAALKGIDDAIRELESAGKD